MDEGMGRDLDKTDYVLMAVDAHDPTPEEASREFNHHIKHCSNCDPMGKLCFTGQLLNDVVSTVAAEAIMAQLEREVQERHDPALD